MARSHLLVLEGVLLSAAVAMLACGSGDAGTDDAGDAGTSGNPTTGDDDTSSDDTDSTTSDTAGSTDEGTDTTGPDPEPFCGDSVIDSELGEACDDGGESPTCTAACAVKAPVADLTNFCVTLEDGRTKCWGPHNYLVPHTEHGSCGVYPGTMGAACLALDFGENEVIRAVRQRDSLCILLADGRVACLGPYAVSALENQQEYLEYEFEGPHGYLPKEADDMTTGLHALSFPDAVVDVNQFSYAATGDHGTACALTSLGTVYCWGNGLYGLRGSGDETALVWRSEIETSEPLDLPESMVSLVSQLPCAVSATGKLYCWGPNEGGELLIGDAMPRGDQPGEMGSALPPAALSGGMLLSVAGTHKGPLGDNIRCALMDDGYIRCWGHVGRMLPEYGAEVYGDDPGELWDEVPTFRLDEYVETTKIVVGGISSACTDGSELAGSNFNLCGLLADGRVKCIGKSQPSGIGYGLDKCWLDVGEVEPMDLGEPAIDIAGGGSTTCVLLESQRVKCWGDGNWHGGGSANGDGTIDPFPTANADLPYLEF